MFYQRCIWCDKRSPKLFQPCELPVKTNIQTDQCGLIHKTNDSFELILLMNRSLVCAVWHLFVWLTLVYFSHSHQDSSWWCNVCFICCSGCSLTYLSAGELMSWRLFDLRTQIFLSLTPSVQSISMFHVFSVTKVLHIKLG